MIEHFISEALSGQSVWLPNVRADFDAAADKTELIFSLTLSTGQRIDRSFSVVPWRNREQRDFIREYLNACVFNMLSVFGGTELRIYTPQHDPQLLALLDSLPEEFSSGGLKKCVNVSDRIARSLGQGCFSFAVDSMENYIPVQNAAAKPAEDICSALLDAVHKQRGKSCIGIDIGGTDIKLAAAKGDELICIKEYDWSPSESTSIDGIIEPILLLIRLMRCCLAAYNSELFEALRPALAKSAGLSVISEAVEAVENTLGERINVLDAVGVSFPDVVIYDRIVGGETPKTLGVRNNKALDYESEFRKLTELKDTVLKLCKPSGLVRIVNDGNMSAFTAAVELAHTDRNALIGSGVIAHSLGTDLGTGLLLADGTVPPLPLEFYDCLLDLGSVPKRRFPLRDLRCVCNENSHLPGVRRYMGQAAVFRLAWELEPSMLNGFVTRDGEMVYITEKPDMRKPCLEHIMELAAQGYPPAQQVFLTIGENLGQVCRELEYLLDTGIRFRFLFGRFVKRPEVFELICRGCRRTVPDIELIAADSDMAFSPLMKALADRPDATVAQFGQAVGAVYFSFT